MPVLPPAQKLPLAVRKDIRDNFDQKRPDLEKQLTDILGVPWTIDIDPLTIWPYATYEHAKERTGQMITSYIEGAIYKLKSFLTKYGDDGKTEINNVCTAHVITMAFDEAKKFSYCGVDIKDGKLRILFAWENLAVNVDDALEKLHDAINEAPQPNGSGGLSPAARLSIKTDYDPKVEEVRKKFADMFSVPGFKLNPMWEENFQKLKENEKAAGLRSDWEQRIGSFFLSYFEGAIYKMNYQKFGEDEMLQEGFNEEVSKNEIAIRVVDKLDQGSYNEAKIEDGVLYLQTTPKTWDTNVDDVAAKLMDLL